MKYLIALFLLFFCAKANGQQQIFNSIPLNNNLPSKECYGIFQDERGYIWITTELGLCRLSGSELQVYNKNKGLPENSIYAFFKHGNKHWLVSSKNRLLSLVNDQLSESTLSTAYKKIADKYQGHTYQLYASTGLIANHNTISFQIDTLKSRITRIHDDEKILINWNKKLSLTYGKLAETINGTVKLQVNNVNNKKLIINTVLNNSSSHRFLTVTNGEYLFVSLGKILFKIDRNNNYQILNLPSNVINLYIDDDKDLWIGLYKNGVYYCSNGDIHNPLKNLPSLSVSGILQDKEGNIWCTTLEKGVFMSKTKAIINFSNILGDYYGQSLIKTVEDKTLFLRNNRLYTINGNSTSLAKNTIKESANKFIAAYQKQTLFFNTTQIYDFVELKEAFYTISYGNICKINANELRSQTLTSPGRCIATPDQNTILYGCDNGIYSLNIKKNLHKKIASTPDRPTKILISRKKDCLIATKGSGIFLLSGNHLIPYHLPIEIVYDITEDEHDNLWFASNKGLIKVGTDRKIGVFTTLNGLPSNEVYKLTINSGKLFCLTSEGLISIPLNVNLIQTKSPSIYLKAATTFDTRLNFSKTLVLDHFQNSIKLKFDLLSFKNDKAKLRYRILPLDTVYRYSPNEQIELENLPPNNYQLQVQGVNSDGVASKLIKFHFQIKKPIWQMWWFVTTASIIIVTLVYVVSRYIFIKTRKKELEKARIKQIIAESKLTALQAQMNPHFIFNCINSIQKYILKKQEKDAYNYLSKFSQLIRMVLMHSQEKNITLADELVMLDLYISLEQLRFNNSFEYHKNIADDVDLNHILIPALLIQPYVENAIWHGLMHLDEDKKGKLTIAVKLDGLRLVIKVTDNGIGRKLAAEYRRDNLHQPLGMNINDKRIDVLNQTSHESQRSSVQITDLPNHSGTEVSIYIPVNL